MAITVNTQTNPNRTIVGTALADCTIITSGFTTGTTQYQVVNLSNQDQFTVSGYLKSRVYAQILYLSVATMKVQLPFRTNFKVRVRNNGGAWSAWTTFKTRDKQYSTPDAMQKLTVTKKKVRDGEKIVVTNSAKATVTQKGKKTVNTDKIYNSVTSIKNLPRGNVKIKHSD